MRFSLVTGVGVNLSRLESKLICSFVSCSFERFLICCLLGSTAQRNRFLFAFLFRSFFFRFLTVDVLLLRIFPLLLNPGSPGKTQGYDSHSLFFVTLLSSDIILLTFEIWSWRFLASWFKSMCTLLSLATECVLCEALLFVTLVTVFLSRDLVCSTLFFLITSLSTCL